MHRMNDLNSIYRERSQLIREKLEKQELHRSDQITTPPYFKLLLYDIGKNPSSTSDR